MIYDISICTKDMYYLNMRYLPYFQLLILLNDFPVHKANVWLFVYKFWLPFDVVLPFLPILDPWPDILLCFRPIVWWRHPKRWTIDHVPVGSNFAPHVLDQAICWGQKKKYHFITQYSELYQLINGTIGPSMHL